MNKNYISALVLMLFVFAAGAQTLSTSKSEKASGTDATVKTTIKPPANSTIPSGTKVVKTIPPQNIIEYPISGTPDGFPKYIDTGNSELDRANYAEAKKAWILANEQKYNSMLKK
jgi:hypothetical protein